MPKKKKQIQPVKPSVDTYEEQGRIGEMFNQEAKVDRQGIIIRPRKEEKK